ncbi:helix-turn-helix domain-containing protein [Rhizobium sp. PAMB 3182]
MKTRILKKHPSKKEVFEAILTLNQSLGCRFDLPSSALLNSHSDDALLSPMKAASLLGVSQKTLANWRCSGVPKLAFVQVGSRIFYRQADINCFVLHRRKQSTSDRGSDVDA